jgi:NADH-quinone oxidoreductase subunit L
MPFDLPLALIILFPLAGFAICGLIGSRMNKPWPGVIASAAVLASFIIALIRVINLASLPQNARVINETVYTWISVGALRSDVSFLFDPLSAVMILIITGVGFLIHLYSIGYMAEDHNDEKSKLYARYFCWLNLIVAFMSLLVLADNFLLMFVGWEGVGLCSYFLIGYWFKREDAMAACKKAFIVNRIGDFGFLLAMMLIFIVVGSLNYDDVFAAVRTSPQLFSAGILGTIGAATLIPLLLFVGATGKSAQIPLFVWLPDAMAGPTPVSALIHAATMVTAGVYMVSRSSALFLNAPDIQIVICVIGALTAFFAAITALAHTDIKKVLAYSTVSQLGFMFMAVGVGAYAVAIFHVFTHAFFKACLFLGSGSVIHSLHGEQDMDKMGGLARKMQITNITFLAAGLALAGAAPFAGFFSKDEILDAVLNAGHGAPILIACGIVGFVAALLTGIYTGRQYAQVFLGEARDETLYEHAHESGPTMTIPLIVLGIGSLIVGFLGMPHLAFIPAWGHVFTNWLEPVFATGATAEAAPSVLLLLIGLLIGWGSWIGGVALGKNAVGVIMPESLRAVSLDAIYNATIVRAGYAIADACHWIDDTFIDGIVKLVGCFVGESSDALRTTQTSFVRNYALAMAVGAVIVLAWFIAK